jgi:hypothetical protein
MTWVGATAMERSNRLQLTIKTLKKNGIPELWL